MKEAAWDQLPAWEASYLKLSFKNLAHMRDPAGFYKPYEMTILVWFFANSL